MGAVMLSTTHSLGSVSFGGAMCGIIGYAGSLQAAKVLIEGLGTLEYRGYDSAGIAVVGQGRSFRECISGQAKLSNLKGVRSTERCRKAAWVSAHTRWGKPTGGPQIRMPIRMLTVQARSSSSTMELWRTTRPSGESLVANGHVFQVTDRLRVHPSHN